jgi:hypothetical protein
MKQRKIVLQFYNYSLSIEGIEIMTNKRKSLLSLGVLVLSVSSFVFADDTIETKVKNAGEDGKTELKKGVRKTKKAHRKATGTDSKAKDAKDSVEDAKDEINSSANKMKNKLEE